MEKNILLEQIEKGYSSYKIAKNLNKSPTTIAYWLKQYNLKTNHTYHERNNNKYSYEEIFNAVSTANCIADVLRNLNLITKGHNFRTIKKYILKYNIDTSHFDPTIIKNKIKEQLLNSKKRYTLEEIFKENSTYLSGTSLKKKLYENNLKEEKCEMCGQNNQWFDKKLVLILDHINGKHNDNRLENLRIVCPNCNSTLDTHCGRNLKKHYFCKCGNNICKTSETCKKCASLKRQKVNKPSHQELLEKLKELKYNFVQTGKFYNVSDNAIRKWLKESM